MTEEVVKEITLDPESPVGDEPPGKSAGMIAQLLSVFRKFTIGQDLTLNPMTMPDGFEGKDTGLERFQNGSLKHSDILIEVNDIDDPVLRVVQVLKWIFTLGQVFMSKKPLNPVLGEVSVCKFYSNQPKEGNKNNGRPRKGNDDEDDDDVFKSIAEQVCHHPPKYFNENKKRGISVFGYSKANIKFMGTAVKLALEGTTKISFDKFNEVYSYLYQTKHTKIQKIKEEKEEKEEEKEGKEKRRDKRRYKDEVMIERYSPPTIMIRFIGFVLEYAGDFEMTCSNHPYVARITYKEKPYLRGKYHRLKGKIVKVNKEKTGKEAKKLEEVVMKFAGHWNDEVVFEDLRNKQTFKFLASEYPMVAGVPVYPSLEDDLPQSSRKIWNALKTAPDSHTISKAKKEVEEEQRRSAKERADKGEEHKPKFFTMEEVGGTEMWRANPNILESIVY